ncbi:MAG: diguanylate cyclase [Planctomycetota bacterium]
MQLQTFEELKLSGNLPTPAGVGMRILQLTRTEDFSAEEMGDAIRTDPSLTGRILKLANSASHSGLEPATTVSEAIMRLGSRTVRDLALAFSLVSERKAGTCKAFDYELYWTRSLARAVAAQTLYRVRQIGKPEEAYICGLLSEIGLLALASVYSEPYSELLCNEAGADMQLLVTVEREQFNIDHSEVGQCMLEDWGLPERFAEAIGAFTRDRRPRADITEIKDLTTTLRFATLIAEACVTDESTPAREFVRIGDGLEHLRDVLGLDDSGFQRFCDTCANEWAAWGESLDIPAERIRFSHVFNAIALAREVLERAGESVSPSAGGPAPVKAYLCPLRNPNGLPAERPSDAAAAVPALAGSAAVSVIPPTEERFNVLAIDDDPVSLRLLVRHMRNDGYQVEMARGGKEGLKAALRTTPDILVVDQEMPDIDGLEVVRSLRRTEAGASMFILLLTGNESEDMLVRAFDAGVDDFIAKPFIPRVMSARIKGGIRLAKLQRKTEFDKQTIMRQVAELGRLTRKLRAASLTDSLTELPNRRYAMKRLESEWAASQRSGRGVSVVMIDIDHFKSVNDTYGHDMGDFVLKETAAVLKGALREEDEVCRLGGEEFLVICRNTSTDDCCRVAARIRKAVEEHQIQQPAFDRGHVTISLGFAGSDLKFSSIAEMLKAADEAVYAAKNGGRNQARRYDAMDCVSDAGAPPVSRPRAA